MLNGDSNEPRDPRRGQDDRRPSGREPQCVVEQPVQCLPQPGRIGAHPALTRRALEEERHSDGGTASGPHRGRRAGEVEQVEAEFVQLEQVIRASGVYEIRVAQSDEERMHGNDERVPLSSLHFGTRLIYGAIERIAR